MGVNEYSALTPSDASATLAAIPMPANGPSSAPLTYAESITRLLSLADYERMAGRATLRYKHDLDRMRELAHRAGGPPPGALVVHIAGTKGKGSVAAMVTSILNAAGLRTVTFTSPHLHTFRERIAIDGGPCSEAQFAGAVERIWPHVEAMAAHGAPSTFEVLTAMAFGMARVEEADVLVLEAGLGGRLDSTNVADAAVSVVTSISLDHMAILGDTLEAIAAEKAGIIKSNAPVVVAPQQPEAMAKVAEAARLHAAPLVRAGVDVLWKSGAHDLSGQAVSVQTACATYELWIPLLGTHQQENAAVAIAAMEALGVEIAPEVVAAGLRAVRWDGRFQVLSRSPYLIVDGAHNAYSMSRLCETVRECLPSKEIIAVFGCSSDKNARPMVDELARLADKVFVSVSHHPRALAASALQGEFTDAGVECETSPDVAAALEQAMSIAGADGVVLVTGSLFVVAEALEAWYGLPAERYPEFDPQRTAVHRGKT